MDSFWITYVLSLLAAGLVSGFASGLFGVGGGIVRVPLFLYLFPIFGVHHSVVMHLAAGTSLTLAIPSSISASRAQYKAGNLDFPFLRVWIPALVLGVVLGLFVMRFVSGRFLIQVFAFLILAMSLQMFFTTKDFKLTEKFPGRVVMRAISFIIGCLSTMVGLTGGSFTTPALTAFGYPIHRAIAVATAGGLFISLIGAAGSVYNGLQIAGRPEFSFGYVDLTSVLVMAPAVLLSAPYGVKLGNRLSQDRLRKIFAIFLFIVSMDMFYDLYTASH